MAILLLILFFSCLSACADVRIMSYNIKDFRLRFDGEPDSITDEDAAGGPRAIGVKALKLSSVLPSGQFLYPKSLRLAQPRMNQKEWYALL